MGESNKMTMPKPGMAVQHYKSISLENEIEAASPHRLIQMLMEGVFSKIGAARHCIMQSNIPGKGENISMAISIIDGLRVSLDKTGGGEIAENLDNLYDYMERRLFEANVKSDVKILDEVSGLLGEIKSAWDAIGPEVAAMTKST